MKIDHPSIVVGTRGPAWAPTLTLRVYQSLRLASNLISDGDRWDWSRFSRLSRSHRGLEVKSPQRFPGSFHEISGTEGKDVADPWIFIGFFWSFFYESYTQFRAVAANKGWKVGSNYGHFLRTPEYQILRYV